MAFGTAAGAAHDVEGKWSAVTSAVVESPRGIGDALRGAIGLGGVLAFAVGLLVLLWPGRTAMVVTAIVAAYLVVAGLGYVVAALGSRARSAWGRLGHLLLGVLYVLAGGFALSDLSAATASLATLLGLVVGVVWVVEGVVALTTLPMMTGSKGWTAVFAVLSIVAGVLALLSPAWAVATLWWLVGVVLVVLGVVQIARALAWRVEPPPVRATFGPPAPFPRR